MITMFPVFAFAETDEPTEFVAVSRFVIKGIDDNGVIHLKKFAPKPTSEEIPTLENGYPIIFAEKKGEGEPSEKIKTTVANIFAQKVGTYTFNYEGKSTKIEIKLPEYGYYTKPEASPENQMLGSARFEKGKETVVYMIVTEPEQLKKIEFSFHDAKMGEYATLEQMGEYGEICKITVTKPTDFIRIHCGRTFLNGDFDNSGNGFGITVRPEKTALNKLSTSSKTIKASWTKQSVAGYQVKIATNKAFTKGVKTYNVTGSSKTFKKLVKGKRYYVKVRAYRYAWTPYYGKWSTVRSVVYK